MQDTEAMTLGMWVDYIIEYNNMQKEADKRYKQTHDRKTGAKIKRRKATQSDFNNF